MDNSNKYYLGIDLHRNNFTAYGINFKGEKIVEGRYPNSDEAVEKLISSFPHPPETVIEATRNWMWLVDKLSRINCQVKLAHPLKTKAIASAKIKTDKLDAKILCHLLKAEMISSSYVASYQELENREIARGRINLVRDQTKIKNRIKAILAKENLNGSQSDIFGQRGRVWMAKQNLSPAKKMMIGIYLERLDEIKKTLKKIDKIIEKKAAGFPEVSLLCSIPSIGTTTAFTILAEVGEIKRFPTAHHLSAYLGMVPRLHQSGNHTYYGRITKLGNTYVRWALVQAAHRLVRMNIPWAKRVFQRLSFKGGRKKAIVAVARKLAVVIYHILKEKRPYITNYHYHGHKITP